MSELLPCPFCGDKPAHGYSGPMDGSGVLNVIFCPTCGAQSLACATTGMAIIRWNTRLASRTVPEGGEAHALSIRIEQRPDGGIRVWSPHVRGLILSGSDPCKVLADVWPAITALLQHKNNLEQQLNQPITATSTPDKPLPQ